MQNVNALCGLSAHIHLDYMQNHSTYAYKKRDIAFAMKQSEKKKGRLAINETYLPGVARERILELMKHLLDYQCTCGRCFLEKVGISR